MDLTMENMLRAAFEGALFLLAIAILVNFVGPTIGWQSGYEIGVGYVVVWLAYVAIRAIWLGRKELE